jgi:hypothetical protein
MTPGEWIKFCAIRQRAPFDHGCTSYVCMLQRLSMAVPNSKSNQMAFNWSALTLAYSLCKSCQCAWETNRKCTKMSIENAFATEGNHHILKRFITVALTTSTWHWCDGINNVHGLSVLFEVSRVYIVVIVALMYEFWNTCMLSIKWQNKPAPDFQGRFLRLFWRPKVVCFSVVVPNEHVVYQLQQLRK